MMKKIVIPAVGLLMVLSGGCHSLKTDLSPAEMDGQLNGKKELVLAFYQLGFETPAVGQGWRQWSWDEKPHQRDPEKQYPGGRRDIAGIHYPLIGPYDSTSEDVLEYHVLLAKAAGIDGFTVNWYGFKDARRRPRYEDRSLRKLMGVAERLDFKVCIQVEDKSMFPPFQRNLTRRQSLRLAQRTIRKIFSSYGQSPAYLKIGGRPVLTHFGWASPSSYDSLTGSFTPREWRKILRAALPPEPFFIANHHWHWEQTIFETGFLKIADSLYPWVADSAKLRRDFYTQAKKAKNQKKISLLSGEVCPGFDNYGTWGRGAGRVVIPRQDGEVYARTWQECRQQGVRLIQIITWNNFAEGTTIEPTRDYGYHYLEMTAEATARPRGRKPDYASLRIPEKIYGLRQGLARLGAGSKTRPKRLKTWVENTDRAVALMVQGEYAAADALAKQTLRVLAKAESKVKAPRKIELTLDPQVIQLRAGETKTIWVEVKNHMWKKIRGKVELKSGREISRRWFNRDSASLALARGKSKRLPFRISVPKKACKQQAKLEARFVVNGKIFRSHLAIVNIGFPGVCADLGPRNLLQEGKENEIRVRITGPEEDYGTISLSLPPDWKGTPDQADYAVQDGQAAEVFFRITPATTRPGTITARIYSRSQGVVSVKEPFQASNQRGVILLEGDIDADGEKDYVLGNRRVEVHIAPALGGRILGFFWRSSGNNQLFSDPKAIQCRIPGAQSWVEYGGINDSFAFDWPGEVWNIPWKTQARQEANGAWTLLQSVESGNRLRLERQVTLNPDSQELILNYTVKNLGPEKATWQWYNHPNLAPGKTPELQSQREYLLPMPGRMLRKPIIGNRTKECYAPAKNWCLGLEAKSGEYFLQRFDLQQIRQIGIWQEYSFFTMELLSEKTELAPGEKKSFGVRYIIGKGDWMKYIR